ncbi:MAG: tetratricopeptide repeat protein [Nitrospinota bacterium]
MSGWDWAVVTAAIVSVVAGALLALWGMPLYSVPAFLIALIAVTQLVEPLKKIFKPDEPPGTLGGQEQTHQKLDQILEQLNNPPLEDVRSEVEREIASELETKGYDVLSLYTEGNRLYETHRYPEAVEKFQAALKIVDVPSFRIALGNSLVITGQLDKAFEQYSTSLKDYRKTANKTGEASDLGNIGNVHSQGRELQEALQSHEAALKIHRQIGNRLGEANALNNIGVVHGQREELHKALKAFEEAREIHRHIKDPLGEANALGNIGNVHFQHGELEKALESHESALKIHRQIGNPLGKAQDLGNIGNVQRDRGELEMALQSYEAALKIFREVGARLQIEMTEKNIAQVKAQMQKRK